MKNKVQFIGDNNNKFDDKKNITICVFNSVKLIEDKCDKFEKIYIDEAHHIRKPEIYQNDKDSDSESDKDKDSDSDKDSNSDRDRDR